jgi:HSP20 family protein
MEATIPAKHEEHAVETRERRLTIMPPVDIFEVENGLAVVADMPGVDREAVEIRVENDILTIEAAVTPPAQGEIVYSEFALANYHRQFRLSDKVDTEKIHAELKNGVLTIHLPKAEAHRPRRIEVTTA